MTTQPKLNAGAHFHFTQLIQREHSRLKRAADLAADLHPKTDASDPDRFGSASSVGVLLSAAIAQWNASQDANRVANTLASALLALAILREGEPEEPPIVHPDVYGASAHAIEEASAEPVVEEGAAADQTKEDLW